MCEAFTALTLIQQVGLVSSVGGLAMNAGNAIQQGNQQAASAKYDAAISRNNAISAGYQADDAIARGELSEKQHRLQVAQAKGQQRSSIAGNGFDIGSGSALNTLQDTAELGELDALIIRHNAALEAWGYKNQAGNFESQAVTSDFAAKNARANGSVKSAGSLLSGGAKVASSWYKLNTKKQD